MKYKKPVRKSISFLICMLIGVSLLTGCAGTAPKQKETRQSAAQKKRAMDLFIDGKVAEAKEKFAEAITCYIEALQYDPESEDIAFAIARAFFKERKTRSALYYARMAVRLNPKKPTNWRLLQQLEQIEGRTAEAAEALKMYIKLSPESDFFDVVWLARYYFDIGREKEAKDLLLSVMKDNERTAEEMSGAARLLADKSYFEEALSIYRRIVERDPMNVNAWISLGNLYEDNKWKGDARNAYLLGFENNPGSVDLMVLIGNMCLYENDWDCAINYFEKAVAKEIKHTKINKTLCALYYYAGRESDAVATFNRLKEEGNDNSPLYFSLGKAMNYLERYEEADKYYKKGFEKADDKIPEDSMLNAYRGYASTLIHLDRHEDAIELIRGSAGSYIKNREAIKLLEASVYLDLKRYDDAIAIYDWLLASDPKNIHYILTLGQAYTASDRFDKAEETLLKVADINPDNIGHLIQLSLVYDFTGQFKKAEKSLLKVLKIEPENALALNNLAYMYIEHDVKISKATEMVKRALVLEPRNGAYHDTLGWGYYKKGKYKEARKYIESALKWEDTPDKGVIYDHYGDILIKLDKNKEAIEAYRKAIELSEDKDRIQQKLDKLQ